MPTPADPYAFLRYYSPTPEPPCASPLAYTELNGKIIFWTDRNTVLTPTPQPYSGGPFEPIRSAPGDAIYIMDANGDNQRPLGMSPKCAKALYDYFLDRMAVTADGQWRLTVERSGAGTSLFLRDTRGQLVRRLTTLDGLNYSPAWSPDQGRVAFVSEVDMNDEIYTVTADGTKTRRLTFNTWEWDKGPSWSPDGKRVVFWSNRETQRKQIWTVNSEDGGQPANLSHNGFNDWDPIWLNF